MKKRFDITCTMIYNGTMKVEAETEEEALEIAQDRLSSEYGDDFPDEGMFGDGHFSFGEATADYADVIDSEYLEGDCDTRTGEIFDNYYGIKRTED